MQVARTALSRRELLGGGAALALGALLEGRALAAAPPLPFPELEASGSPGELGLAHGRRFAAVIARNVAFYRRYLAAETRADAPRLLELAARFAGPIGAHAPEQLEEIEGIARGARLRREEILLLNARSDLLVLGKRRPASRPSGCTALGQNWDWDVALRAGTVVLRLRPRGRARLVTFSEAGMVGKIGMSEHRLGVCLNFLSHRSDAGASAPGLPVHCLLRAALGCTSLEEAYKLIAWAPRSASANLLLAQHAARGPQALSLELTPNALARLPLEGGELVHANHFKHPALAAGCEGAGGRSTTNRDRTASELARSLRERERDPAARLRRVLALRQGAPLSVSKTRAPGSESETLAGIVMDLTRNQLCRGRPTRTASCSAPAPSARFGPGAWRCPRRARRPARFVPTA